MPRAPMRVCVFVVSESGAGRGENIYIVQQYDYMDQMDAAIVCDLWLVLRS